MTTRVHKWGNSLALRIPKPFAEEAGLEPDSVVDITVKDGSLLITPTPKRKRQLQELLSGITEENRHGETDWGKPVGREIW
jgi:antitoxin MazE